MNTNQIIKDRNNGKSKYYYNHAKKNIILTDNKDQGKPQPRDLSLFNMAITFNVRIDSRQRVRWYLNIINRFEVSSGRTNIEKICSRYSFIGKRKISLIKIAGRDHLVVDTPLFLFTLDNIVQFSNALLEFAKENSLFYERWEVVPSQTTLLTRIKRLFN